MAKRQIDAETSLNRASPPTHQQAHECQPYGDIVVKQHEDQNELDDTIAEPLQLPGGVRIALALGVAETTLIPRAPKGREEVPVQISRLLRAHEILLQEA